MRVCEKLVWSWLVGEWHLEEGGGGKGCEVMEGKSGVREDVGAVLVTLRMKGRKEASCPSVVCQMRAAKCKLLLRAAVG